jgi:3-oxoacyl-[acyl-carrier-protein] synthase III
MHPFASAAAGARAMPRTAVQRISGFIVDLLKKHSLQQSGFQYLVPEMASAPGSARHRPAALPMQTVAFESANLTGNVDE